MLQRQRPTVQGQDRPEKGLGIRPLLLVGLAAVAETMQEGSRLFHLRQQRQNGNVTGLPEVVSYAQEVRLFHGGGVDDGFGFLVKFQVGIHPLPIARIGLVVEGVDVFLQLLQQGSTLGEVIHFGVTEELRPVLLPLLFASRYSSRNW